LAETPAQGDNLCVASTPQIKRYALVRTDAGKGVRRLHLARVAAPREQRLERMEDVAARDRPRKPYAAS
jgi:hypothetical protein